MLADEVGKIIKAKNCSERKNKSRVNMTTRELLRKQVIISIVKSNAELIVNLVYQHIANIIKFLKNIKSDIIAVFIKIIYYDF